MTDTTAESPGRLALSVAEAAETLGLSERTVQRLVRDRAFAVVRVGRRTLIPRAGLEEWLRGESKRQARH